VARTARLTVAVRPAGAGVVRIACGRGDASPHLTDDAISVRSGASGLTVRDADGNVLCEAGQPRGERAWVWRMPAGTQYFGLGERTGLLEKKGGRYTFWNTDEHKHQGPESDSLYQSIPFFLAVDGGGVCHGVLIDSVARSVIDLSNLHSERLMLHAEEAVLRHYVIAGPTPDLVVRRLTELTGRMPLPPKWALGYHHTRWGYRDESDIRRVAQRLRAEGVPSDGVYLDIDHQDEFRTFTWSPKRFPDPARLVADLGEAGFKIGVTVNVGVKYQPEGGYEVFDDGLRRDVFLRDPAAPHKLLLRHVWPGLCAFPDFVRADVRDWWGGWYERLLSVGVQAVVNDMNEPAMHGLPIRDESGTAIDAPPETLHGPAGAQVPHALIHNAYATLEAEAASSAWRRLRPHTRPMVLSRAGSTGIQRYAAVWTGDNLSVWEHLEMSVPQLLNLGLSGVAFCGADIGGFFGNCGPELLTRWYQWGAWYPLARANNAENAGEHEPWSWGPLVLDACRRALRRRYRLLPYTYTLFAECARTGAPILRPLLYHYPGDPQARLRGDEALLGRDLLLAPVLRPGRLTREVYLPAGRWYGLHDHTVHDGPCTVIADAPLDGEMPVYARAGAIIPAGPDLAYVDEKPLDPLTLHVFPDERGEAEGALYEDDGSTMSHMDDDCARTAFRYTAGELTARTTGRFKPAARRTIVKLV